MYYYVYDEFIQDSKFERDLALIETRLTDLGIAGKITRLALFRDPKEMIRDEIRKGMKTIVSVGNDLTLRKVIDAIKDSGVAIGSIPVGKEKNTLSDILGVPIGVDACDVLSARIIEELDLGEVNGKRFLHSAVTDQVSGIKISIKDQYSMTPYKKCRVEIRNLTLADDEVAAANPVDGRLECVLRSQPKGWLNKKPNITMVPASEITISSENPIKCSADGEEFESDELKFKIIPKTLKVITGKARKF